MFYGYCLLQFVISRMFQHLCDVSALLKSSGAMMLNYWNNMSTKTYQHWHPMPFWVYPSKHQYWYTSKNISNIRFICRKSSIIYQSFMRNNGATPDCWALNFQAAKRLKKNDFFFNCDKNRFPWCSLNNAAAQWYKYMKNSLGNYQQCDHV